MPGEGDKGDNDTCLSHQLHFDLEDSFIIRARVSTKGRKERQARRRVLVYDAVTEIFKSMFMVHP